MMIDKEHRESMQRSLEAPLGCLRVKTFQYNFQETAEGFPVHKDEIHVDPGNTVESENSSNREASAPPNQGFNIPFHQQELWPNFYSDGQKLQHGQWNTLRTHFYPMNRDYPLLVENRIQYMPLKMLCHSYPHEYQFQEFQYFVVIDFEATCDKEKNPHPQEIIEFPSVLVNSSTGRLEASFQTYVRPSHHQHLTDFCKELTGIQQIQVDRGVPLSEALLMHDKWLEERGIKHKNFAVVTWSNWDCRVMLESECRFKRIRKPPYFNRWINLKVPFQEVFGGVRCNLKDAVQLAGLVWEGRPHCGLDDACNTARLLLLLMHRGFRFSITNSLMWQPMAGHRPGDPAASPQSLHGPPLEPAMVPAIQFHTLVDPAGGEQCVCHCGVKCSLSMIRKPGPTQGRWFYGCGNWTAARRAACNFFRWACSP